MLTEHGWLPRCTAVTAGVDAPRWPSGSVIWWVETWMIDRDGTFRRRSHGTGTEPATQWREARFVRVRTQGGGPWAYASVKALHLQRERDDERQAIAEGWW